MRASTRISTLTGGVSDGWGVFYKARQMKDAGDEITELTIGEHDIRTHATILDAMHKYAKDGYTGYAIMPGEPALRDTVAARVQSRTGVPTTRDNVVITPGGQSALFASHMAATNPGETAAYLDPYYATYPGTIRAVSATPKAIQTFPEHSFMPQRDDLIAATKGAASLLVNTPNNPTGVVYDATTINAIAAACIENDLWCISDEVYDTQIWEGDHISPRQLDGMLDRTMVVGSMSKSHAMTGSRVGWVVGPKDTIDELISLATHTTYGVPGYIQMAALHALNEGDWLETEVGAPFERRRKLVLDLLDQQNLVQPVRSGGAMYVMLDVRAAGMDGENFAYALLEQHKIAVMPGESFGNAAAGHIRVALTTDDDLLVEAIQTILKFTEDLASKR